MNCLLCNGPVAAKLTIRELIWPGRLAVPVVCPKCRQQFMSLEGEQHCPACCRLQETSQLCPECRCWSQMYSWKLTHQALYCYNTAMKEFMHQYKFAGDYRLRAVFAPEFTAAIRQKRAEVVVPIPVTQSTMATRGFNQVTGLLDGVKLTPCLQHRTLEKTAQSHKSRRERLQTPQPFALSGPVADLAGKRVLLVDDVYTTGRTLYHAADLLYRAGAVNVMSISLAR